ncbi:carboxypeptidase-like protein [Aquimarina sp. MAR_2010_214]|uniref:carboxypeptidase-like regulatory domain-containing protein n=1 Tax=Aquimarina sp. MAR_2010_214 TaxID=1250026 RepID=UPI000CBFA0D3|nr:carboxypeptidase-like regulatory domain-containing protein [Aquimarina sp. MAR_2010_214]PKV51524.1 carboxypeptidase-like protein [Aquimarina sp. MAR_2010_214]
MKKTLLLLLIFISGITFSQSKEYSGVVKAKGDNLPLPGVNIIIKGTKIGTQTDFDGNFKITVPDSLRVLSFSYLGFQALEFKLKNERNIEIALKEDCNIDWFDAQHIGFYLNSGVVNNPIGGQFHLTFPAIFGQPTLKSGIGYQTNLEENRFVNAYLNLEHLFVSCDFNVDINSSYRNLDFDDKIDLSAYSIETNLNFNKISAIIGASKIDFVNTIENKNINSIGTTLGIRTWIGRPFLMSVFTKTTIYRNLTEYHTEIKKQYKKVYGFLKYYKVNDFNELSVGIGIEFTYLFKSQKR